MSRVLIFRISPFPQFSNAFLSPSVFNSIAFTGITINNFSVQPHTHKISAYLVMIHHPTIIPLLLDRIRLLGTLSRLVDSFSDGKRVGWAAVFWTYVSSYRDNSSQRRDHTRFVHVVSTSSYSVVMRQNRVRVYSNT